MKPIHPDYPPLVKEVRRQLALSQEGLARAPLDAFCEKMEAPGFLALPKRDETGIV